MPVDLSLIPLRPKIRTKPFNCASCRLLFLTLSMQLPRDQGTVWPSMSDTRQVGSPGHREHLTYRDIPKAKECGMTRTRLI